MIKGSLRNRLIGTYLILAIFGVGGIVLRFGFLEQGRLLSEAERELGLQAVILASAFEEILEKFEAQGVPYQAFRDEIDRLSRNLDVQVTLLTLLGDPIYDNRFSFREMPNQLDQPEVQYALRYATKSHTRTDPLSGEERLYVAALVRHEDKIKAIVQVSISTVPLEMQIRQSWFILAGTALVILLAVVFAGLWLANYILHPLKTIQDAAARMANGNLDQQITIAGQDELSELASAFNHMAAQLKGMMERQQEFVANASHELRTPLTNIKLRAEALLAGASRDPGISQRFLQDIESEVDHMDRLTGNLLALSRIDEQQPVPQSPFDFGPFLANVAELFSLEAQAKRISLSLDAPASLPAISANADQMRQVFDNLLGNAIKFTPPNQEITIAAHQIDGNVTVTVTNAGTGIPPEDLPHIFERFYQSDKARTRTADAPGGTGLGLSIVAGIVEAHRGKIDVASSPGQGTTFTLRFPITEQPSK